MKQPFRADKVCVGRRKEVERSKQIQLVQFDPKIVWDSTEIEVLRRTREEQDKTLERILDSTVTVHVATKFDGDLVARRIASAEIRQRPA
jgi:hypothetical protein